MLNKIIELDWRDPNEDEKVYYSHGALVPKIAIDSKTKDVYTLSNTMLRVISADGSKRSYKLIHVVSVK